MQNLFSGILNKKHTFWWLFNVMPNMNANEAFWHKLTTGLLKTHKRILSAQI